MFEKILGIGVVVIIGLFIFRMTECEMHRIDANRQIKAESCGVGQFCDDKREIK